MYLACLRQVLTCLMDYRIESDCCKKICRCFRFMDFFTPEN